MARLLRVATYNPMSVVRVGRMDDISTYFQGQDVVALVGTQLRSPKGVQQGVVKPMGKVRLSEYADICPLLSPSAYRGVGGRAFGCSEMGCPTILPIALG
mmetsp:Transcript_30590/g.81166  ORF Transcript_30590/g.81166 Transcript_30590/m.81166 type:complete len:100 (-) Transcript_30590:72-371(-)